jgi:hypothetical protein
VRNREGVATAAAAGTAAGFPPSLVSVNASLTGGRRSTRAGRRRGKQQERLTSTADDDDENDGDGVA